MDGTQREQLELLVGRLANRRICLLWQIEGKRISSRHVISILRCIRSVCRGKRRMIHNEICTEGKKVSRAARRLMKRLQAETYEDNRIRDKDYACLYYGNKPKGCSFSSCLGKTVFLQAGGAVSLCPYGTEIRLNPLKNGEPLTGMFETGEFRTLLRGHIQKREQCRAECLLFDVCRGGCPLDDGSRDFCGIRNKVREQENRNREEDEYVQKAARLADLYRL